MKKKTIISQKEIKAYEDAEYEITTLIPYAKKPVKIKRIISQEELDNFLIGYERYAEFAVKVERK